MEYNKMVESTTTSPQSSVFRFEAYPGPGTLGYNIDENRSFNPMIHYPPQSSFFPPQMPCVIPTPISPITPIPTSFNFNAQTGGGTPMGSFALMTYNTSAAGMKHMLGKRKLDSPPPYPSKQLITDEKMAEHMSKLHINSETAMSSLESDSVKTKRLYMCEEMRKLQADPILPQSLLARMEQPCTALVLWRPPARLNLEELNNNNGDNQEDESTGSANRLPSIVDSQVDSSMDLDS